MNQTYQIPRHLLKIEIKVCHFCSNSGNKSLLMCVVHFIGEQSVFCHFDIHSAAHISCLMNMNMKMEKITDERSMSAAAIGLWCCFDGGQDRWGQ